MDRLTDGSSYTTDATPTDGLFFEPIDGASYVVVLYAIARQEDGTGRAAFRQVAILSKNAGVTQAEAVGVQEKITNAGGSTWLLQPAIVNNQMLVRFTGAVGATINCYQYLEGFRVGPFQGLV